MFTKKRDTTGFTLIELLTAIAIFILLASFIMPIYGNLQSSTMLKDSEDQVTQILRVAQNYSFNGKDNSTHGVYFNTNNDESDELIIFSGPSFASRDATLDEKIVFEKSVIIASTFDSNELIFLKLTGLPNQSGIVNISSKTVSQNSNISVNTLGVVGK